MTDITPPLDLAQLQALHALFVRTAAHALRTPLQSLQGFAELLEPSLPPTLAEHYISFIKRDAAYLAGVVDDLALRHELAQGPVILFPTVVEVGPFLHEAACTFEARLPDCLVAIEYSEDLPALYADREHLFHIVFTLLRNAERCRPDTGHLGGLTVCARHEVGARQVVFVVEDDGLRIPIEYNEAIFEPFAALPPALGRPRLGIGLGLCVARAVARQMGGNLYLAPKANCSGQHGNAFVLTMPVAEERGEP